MSVVWLALNGLGCCIVVAITVFLQSLSFILLFWNGVLFRQAMGICNSFWLFATSFFLHDKGFVITGDEIDFDCALVVGNHQVDIDWWYLWKLAQMNRRNQDLKITLKDSLIYLPGVGFGGWLFDFLFLSRKWEKDEPKMVKKFEEWNKQQLRLFFLFFPEGTTINKKAIETSHKYASENNRPKLDLLLLPRTTGLKKALDTLENLTTVYDITIAYPSYSGEVPTFEDGYSRHIDTGIPCFKNVLEGDAPQDKVHIHVEKHDISKVREGNFTEWLDAQWVKKEKRLRQFIEKKTLLLDNE